MATKIYGVEGLTDWQCVLTIGKAKATVHFTGGTMTRYGVTPAEYMTSDPVMQYLIENSEQYKKGRIKLMKVIGEEAPLNFISGHDQERNGTEDASAKEMPDGGEASEEGASEGKEPEVVEVACLTDAQNYLKERFGVTAVRVRNWDKVRAVAAENGIVFKM